MHTATSAVDAVPFAARCGWTSQHDYEIWWEDPRDVYRIVLEVTADLPDPAGVRVDYWQSTWPGIHLPKGALAGAGREGWLAIDDWTNGAWRTADCEWSAEAGTHACTFGPLNRVEFPDQAGFPATFRHTLKLRLHWDAAIDPAAVRAVRAYTDSTWQTADIILEWGGGGSGEREDAYLAAYNGAILTVSPLEPDTRVLPSGAFRRESAGRVRATVRYAAQDDPNSYDRTIVTVNAGENTFSFAINDVLDGTPVFVRDLGWLVTRADIPVRLADAEAEWQRGERKTLHRRIGELPEQTWEAAWAGMPPKRQRIYFVLGCEGARQKFRVEPDGDLMLGENYLRRSPGRDTAMMGFKGKALWFRFGLPGEPADRQLDGELPIVTSRWVEGSVCIEQEAFAAWLMHDMAGTLRERPQGDDPVVAFVRFRLTNIAAQPLTARLRVQSQEDEHPPEALTVRGAAVYAGERLRCLLDSAFAASVAPAADGGLLYTTELAAGEVRTLILKIPFLALTEPAHLARLAALDYGATRQAVVDFWRARIHQGCQIETPNALLNAFYRCHLMHMLVVNDREPGAERNIARCGGFVYGSYPDEGCMVISDLDRRGYHAEAERCLQLYVDYQGSEPLPGNYATRDGVFYGSGGYECSGYNRNQGWVLWCLAEHYRYTRDRAWLLRVAPAVIRGCDWITRERQATRVTHADGTRPIQYGFLPAGSLEDVTDYWTWLSTNAYAAWGLRAAADVLAEIGHPDAPRLDADAESYRRELRAGFFAAARRSPVVRLRDGTWVPHFPPRQERRGRDFGWLREVLEGAVHLIYCGLVNPHEPAARWIIDDYEDNLFNGERTGYPAPDFERQWFGRGGFSMQPNLLLYPPLFLMRDEPQHYLRTYFNPFAAAFYPDVLMLTEHPLPTLADWTGDHFKTSDEANSTSWLRSMFLAEHGDTLFVGQALPRAWFEDGKTMRIERAMTHFGPASAEFVSRTATGLIIVRLDPPVRNAPRRIHLRVRHPAGQPMASVWVNGLPHTAFDIGKEVIDLGQIDAPVEVRVHF